MYGSYIARVSALYMNDSKDLSRYWPKYALGYGQIPWHFMTHPFCHQSVHKVYPVALSTPEFYIITESIAKAFWKSSVFLTPWFPMEIEYQQGGQDTRSSKTTPALIIGDNYSFNYCPL